MAECGAKEKMLPLGDGRGVTALHRDLAHQEGAMHPLSKQRQYVELFIGFHSLLP